MNPLFKGTVHFVKMTFNDTTDNSSSSVSDGDMSTIVAYATKAAAVISLYADQYGECALTVSQNVIPYSVKINSHACSGSQMEGWVRDIANQLPKPSCIAVMLPPNIDNSSNSRVGGTGGFHDSTQGQTYLNAYIESDPTAPGPLTIADLHYFYAGHLSHEMAEMTVNPTGGNPEICDACGPNFNSTYLDYFDIDGNYLQTTQTPPYNVTFAYGFYINGIARPPYAKQAQAPPAACSYGPISVSANLLPQVGGAMRADAFYADDNKHREVVVASRGGVVTAISYASGAPQTSSPIGQIAGLLDVGGFYTPDDKFRHALAVSQTGDVTEIFYGEGQGTSVIGNIPGAHRVSGFYSADDQFRHAIVASSDGSVTEIFYHPTKGHGRDVLSTFQGIVDVGSFYSTDDKTRHAIVATADGNLTEIYFNTTQHGVSQTVVANLPGVVAIAAYYLQGGVFNRRIVALDQSGNLFDVRYNPNYGVSKTKLTDFSQVLDLGGFYSPDDKARHAIVLDAADLSENNYLIP